MTRRKRADWRQGYVPTPQGPRLLRVDRNSERIAISVNRETGEATATVGCEGVLVDSDGSEQKVFVGLDILETLELL